MKKTIKYNGLELDCRFYYAPPCRGSRGCFGEPITPDDPEEFELEQVFHEGENIFDLLSAEAIDGISREIMEKEDDY